MLPRTRDGLWTILRRFDAQVDIMWHEAMQLTCVGLMDIQNLTEEREREREKSIKH